MPRTDADAAHELESLQKRFTLLEEDRKAFYEQSQIMLRANKEQADNLRAENKELKRTLSTLLKSKGAAAMSVGGEALEMQQSELARSESQLAVLRTRHNQLVSANKQKEELVSRADDELQDLRRSGRPQAVDENPRLRQVRTLENRLEKSLLKFNEAQAIRKTYDQIIKRLKEERLSFDSQLSAVEATLRAKKHDHKELKQMSHDAVGARDAARADLADLRTRAKEEREMRERELTERRAAVEARRALSEQMEEREKTRRDIQMASQGDLGVEAERALKQSFVANRLHQTLNTSVIQSEQQVISSYEGAFRKIKESTGVSDVNEVIRKFLTQEETRSSLTGLIKEAQAKLETISSERAATKRTTDDSRYTRDDVTTGSRQEVEAAEARVAEMSGLVERNKARYQRLTKIFIDMKMGIEHIAEKLDTVQLDLPPIPLHDVPLVDQMLRCDAKINQLKESAEATPASSAATALPSDRSDFGTLAGTAASNAFNVRVAGPDEDASDDGSGADDDEVAEGDVPDRDAMKRLHDQILGRQAQTHHNRTKRGSTRGAAAPDRHSLRRATLA